jgi:hypothetical protein
MKYLSPFHKFNESVDPVNNLRYKTGDDTPGIEDYFKNPFDENIQDDIRSQLNNDPYGKGMIKINFNEFKGLTPEQFMQKIEEDAEKNICWTITNYEYKNPSLLGSKIDLGFTKTQITILATKGACKLPKRKPLPKQKLPRKPKVDKQNPVKKNPKAGGKPKFPEGEEVSPGGTPRTKPPTIEI